MVHNLDNVYTLYRNLNAFLYWGTMVIYFNKFPQPPLPLHPCGACKIVAQTGVHILLSNCAHFGVGRVYYLNKKEILPKWRRIMTSLSSQVYCIGFKRNLNNGTLAIFTEFYIF